MTRKKLLLFSLGACTAIVLLSGISMYLFTTRNIAVKGAATSISPTATKTPSPTVTPTFTPTPTVKANSMQPTPTPLPKQMGAWYWNPELGRAQRFLGTDAQGNALWTDTGDPTATPTQKPQWSGSTIGTSSTIQTSSTKTSVILHEVQKKISN